MPIRFEAIIPKLPDMSKYLDEIKRGLDDTGKKGVNLYQPFFSGWDNMPVVKSTVALDRTTYKGYTFIIPNASDEYMQIIKWVIYGTATPEGYTIKPKGPWPLIFQETYVPSTQPGVLQGGPHGYYGDLRVEWGGVTHFGVQARNTTALVKEQLAPWFFNRMTQAHSRGIARAWKK